MVGTKLKAKSQGSAVMFVGKMNRKKSTERAILNLVFFFFYHYWLLSATMRNQSSIQTLTGQSGTLPNEF